MTLMLDHVDSPYIRCIGFLYLRYAADPSTLYNWFEPYLYDTESVQIRQGRADTTVGEYVRMLLENQEYYGTRLPRLPLQLERHFKVKLLQAERIEERAKLHEQNMAAMEYFQKLGSRVQALYGDEENPVTWYDAVVDRVILRDAESGEVLSRPKFQVTFPEYGNTEIVNLGEVDLPGSHAAGEGVGGADDKVRDERPVGRGYDDYNRGYDGRGRDDRGRGYDHRGRDDDYRGRDYSNRRDDPRSDRQGFSNAASRNKAREQEERELLDEVLRREREKSAAKGRDYAARPAGFRGVNADDSVGGKHDIQDKWAPPPRAKADISANSPPSAQAPKKRSAAELAAIEEKKRKLAARYG
jgi:pre-mRNA-splicing factor 38B